jgi:hypothetical protein
MSTLNYLFAVTGWTWLAIAIASAAVIRMRRAR